MSEQAWVGLATLAFLMVSGFFGWLWNVFRKIEAGQLSLGSKFAAEVAALAEKLQGLLDAHERRDEDRHVDVVQRVTRVETIVLNGHGKDQ